MEEKKRNKIHKKLLLIAAALFLILGVWFLVQNHEGQEPEADFFAYTDRDNRLYLWREGNEEPVLLTDCAFAVQEGELGTSYWEAWDYWQEWDEAKGVWIRNEEKALQDVVWKTPDQNLLFPENMQWTVFGMQRGAEERREAACGRYIQFWRTVCTADSDRRYHGGVPFGEIDSIGGTGDFNRLSGAGNQDSSEASQFEKICTGKGAPSGVCRFPG